MIFHCSNMKKESKNSSLRWSFCTATGFQKKEQICKNPFLKNLDLLQIPFLVLKYFILYVIWLISFSLCTLSNQRPSSGLPNQMLLLKTLISGLFSFFFFSHITFLKKKNY